MQQIMNMGDKNFESQKKRLILTPQTLKRGEESKSQNILSDNHDNPL